MVCAFCQASFSCLISWSVFWWQEGSVDGIKYEVFHKQVEVSWNVEQFANCYTLCPPLKMALELKLFELLPQKNSTRI